MSSTAAAGLGVVIASAGAAKLARSRGVGHVTSTLWPVSWRVIGGFEVLLGLALVTLRSRIPTLVAVAFLIAATAYLAVRLALLDRGPCRCWGPRPTPSEGSVVGDALRPAWYFGRNGTLVLMATMALGWSTEATVGAVMVVWILLLAGTTASLLRLHSRAARWPWRDRR